MPSVKMKVRFEKRIGRYQLIVERTPRCMLRSRNLGYNHDLRLFHIRKWVTVRDRLKGMEWIIEIGKTFITFAPGGRCINMSKRLNPRILFRVIMIYYDMEDSIYDYNSELLDVRNGYSDFLSQYNLLKKQTKILDKINR